MIKIFANVCLVVTLAVGAMGNTLKTDVTYLPEDCHTKAASGDQVQLRTSMTSSLCIRPIYVVTHAHEFPRAGRSGITQSPEMVVHA